MPRTSFNISSSSLCPPPPPLSSVSETFMRDIFSLAFLGMNVVGVCVLQIIELGGIHSSARASTKLLRYVYTQL